MHRHAQRGSAWLGPAGGQGLAHHREVRLGKVITNGQQRKWLFTLIAIIVGEFLCLLPGMVIWILSVIDAYQTAQRLQAGEEIGENEYSLPLLFKIMKLIDKEATCSKA